MVILQKYVLRIRQLLRFMGFFTPLNLPLVRGDLFDASRFMPLLIKDGLREVILRVIHQFLIAEFSRFHQYFYKYLRFQNEGILPRMF